MNKIVFLNGEFLEEDKAQVSIFDRGFLFGDGVYEVVPVVNSKMFDVAPFIERLDRSLSEMKIAWPMSKDEYLEMLKKLIEKNDIKEGGVYTQVTRGVAPREFSYPKDTKPTCMAFAFEKKILEHPKESVGVRVVTVEDIRWKRRDVKSISLLAQCVSKQESVEKDGFEGWMVENGFITEGTASTAYIVKDGVIITRPLSNAILPGIRRRVLLEIAAQHDIKIEQRAFSVEEAYEADEAFLSSATNLILPVVKIDDKVVGSGKPGAIYKYMREMYKKSILSEISATS